MANRSSRYTELLYALDQMSLQDASIIGKKRFASRICTGRIYHAEIYLGSLIAEFQMIDEDPVLVKQMIRYFYKNDYDDSPSTDNKNNAWDLDLKPKPNVLKMSPAHVPGHPLVPKISDDAVALASEALMFNTKMYILAEKHNVQDLKRLATTKFKEAARAGWQTPSFIAAVDHLWANTVAPDTTLRDQMASIGCDNLKELVKTRSFELHEVHARAGQFC